MTFATVLSVVGGAIGILGGLAAAYAVIRSSLATTTIRLQAEQVTALSARLEAVKEEAAVCKQTLAKLQGAYDILIESIRQPTRRTPGTNRG